MITTAELFKHAELALAAYADLSAGRPDIQRLMADGRGLAPVQADRFAETYTVVRQHNLAGLSVTVFMDGSGQKYLAIRGTDDGYDIITDVIDIGVLGNTTRQTQYAQLKVQIDAWINDGTLRSTFSDGSTSDQFTVSGHSLGGFLATGVAADFSSKVTHAYLYNAPGLGGILGTILPFDALRSALGIGASSIDPLKVSNIRADAGISPIAGLGVPVASPVNVVIENQFASDVIDPPMARNHSLQPLTDALALLAAFGGLDAALAPAKFTDFLRAGSEQNRLTLETALDALRAIFPALDQQPTGIGQRDAFYRNLYTLTRSAPYVALASGASAQFSALSDQAPGDIRTNAQANDASGLAIRYALSKLNPFALVGADYSALNANGHLHLYDPQAHSNGMTEHYLADRVAFLERKMWFGKEDKLSVNPFAEEYNPQQPTTFANTLESKFFVDAASGYAVKQGLAFANTQWTAFGSSNAEVFRGGIEEDHLYGGGGADLLQAGEGADYMEGGRGTDVYVYSAKKSTGVFSPDVHDGADTILDADGRGVLRYEWTDSSSNRHSTIIGGVARKLSDSQWQSLDGRFTYDKVAQLDLQGQPVAGRFDLVVSINSVGTADANPAGGGITVKDFDFTKAGEQGYLGIRFVELFSAPATENVLIGDRTPFDNDPVAAGVQYVYDLWGNVQGADPEMVRADALYGRDDQADRIQGLGGDDVIFGDTTQLAGPGHRPTPVSSSAVGLADRLEGGEGRDIINAGAGNDWVEGGAHGDILGGAAGNDTLFADSSIGQTLTIAQAISQGDSGAPTSGLKDLLSGDGGDDVLLSSSGADYLAGGEGKDVIVAGAGDDTVYGDRTVMVAPLDWSVTRTVEEGTTNSYIVTPSAGFASSEGEGAADVIYGGAGADWIFAGAGDDFVSAGDKANDDGSTLDDVVLGEGGNDILIGGSGRDVLDGDSAQANQDGSFGDDYIDGGSGDDDLFGGKGDDILIGAEGEDQLIAGDGNDLLLGGVGEDVLQGGAGKDTYVYQRGDGIDFVIDPDFATDSDYLSSLVLGPGISKSDVKFRLGSLAVDAGNGDVIHFHGFDADNPTFTPVIQSIEFADGQVMTYADVLSQGFDLDGTEDADVIAATAVTDRIDAKGGNDMVIAKAGHDEILGGAGNDQIDAGAGNDVVDGGDGADVIDAGEGNDTITTGSGVDIVFGGAGNDVVFAGDGDLLVDREGVNSVDVTAYTALNITNLEVTQFQGPDGETYINLHVRDSANPGVTPVTGGVSIQGGEAGSFATYTLNNGSGGTVTMTAGQLIAQYGAAGIVYRGGGGSDSLEGTGEDDTIFGGAGNDALDGNGGDDRIDGGAGNDTLSGGAGNDAFLLAFNGGRDVIVEDGAAEPNASHTVQLDANVSDAMVYARRIGDNLEVRLRATDDALVIEDFYLQPQSWQDGWQVKDAAGTLYPLEDFLSVVPPEAATWIDEQKEAFRERREQVYLANQEAEGFNRIGSDAFRRTNNTFSYSTATSNGEDETRQLVVNELNNDLAFQLLSSELTGASQGGSSATYTLRRPEFTGGGGTRSAVATGFGGSPAVGSDGGEFIPAGGGMPGMNGGGVRVNQGDVVIPVYRPKAGAGTQIANAGSPTYASSGGFENADLWELSGFKIYRAGGPGTEAREGDVAATRNTPTVTALTLTQQDLAAGTSDNTVSVHIGSAAVDGGAGNDNITLGVGNFFAGPDWQAGFGEESTLVPHPNFLGGFAHGGAGSDTITGGGGQDVLAGGDGADIVEGNGGSDRFLVEATDTSVDVLSDSGMQATDYLDWYYWNRGVMNWREHAEFGHGWRVTYDNEVRYFKTEAEADADIASMNIGYIKDFIEPLAEAAPRLTRDDALYHQLIAQRVLSRDVLEFGPGLTLEDLQITVEVDTFSAADHPSRPWHGGGWVSVRWGASAGVDFRVAAVDFGHEGPNLLSGGWENGSGPEGSWRGYRLGEGIDAFRFADGTELNIDELLANATVVPVGPNFVLERDSGYHLIDRRYGSVELAGAIDDVDVAIKRDGFDLLIDVPGAQGRIRNWYSDPANMPDTRLILEFDPELNAEALTARGLERHGTEGADFLDAAPTFDNPLYGEGGGDTLFGDTGNDSLYGGAGFDLLAGGAGADRLTGGTGNDTLNGGSGKDTYAFDIGDGFDMIWSDVPSGAGDPDASVIEFGEGIGVLGGTSIRFGLSSLADSPGRSLVLSYSDEDSVFLNGFNAANPSSTPVFDRLRFSDESEFTYQDLLDQGFDLTGTAQGESISGTGINDSINSHEGNDFISAGGGTDDIWAGSGDDTMAGGRGDWDAMQGEDGADTYVYAVGDGFMDVVAEWDETPGEVDRLQLQGIASTSARVTRDDYSYYLVFGGTDRLMLDSMARESAAVVERIEFSDGVVWTPGDVAAHLELLPGSELQDALWGTSGNDTIEGLAGNDFLSGNGGNDLLIGGTGGDLYYFAAGHGADVIDAYDTDGGEPFSELADQITFAQAASTDAVLVRNANDLVIRIAGTSDRVTLTGWYGDVNRKIDQIYFEGDGGFWDSGMLETLAPTESNAAPQVASPIADQGATEDAAFSFQVASGTFSDPEGETLTYSATRADGSALPGWLSFNAATRTFSGTPLNADVGVIDIKVTATDGAGASASDTFTVTVANTNDAPTVANAIADQVATEDHAFSFTVPGNAFADVDAGDSLAYTATLADGSALPGWLTFNAVTRTFGGTPLNANVGAIDIKVTATDGSGASASDTFALTVANTNDAPTVADAIADQSATADEAFSFTIAASTFADVDAGDTLAYSATLADGSALPSWLSFDAATGAFSGTPGSGEVGSIDIKVTATDNASASVFDVFTVNVEAGGGATGGPDNLTGTSGSDFIDGLGGDDTIAGGLGDDTLVGGTGNDSMIGGLGNDSYTVDAAGDVVMENAGEGTDIVHSFVDWTLGANFENLNLTGDAVINGTGNALDNWIDGNNVANTLDGGDGNDELHGNDGNDTLIGGEGSDTLDGGAGDDAYYVGTGDVLSDEGGIDEVFADRNWTLGDDFENLTLTGTGNWIAVGNNNGNRITGNVGNNSISGRSGNDTLFGGDGDDTFNVSLGGTSTYGTDTVDGGSGTDVIDWGANALSAVTVNLAAGTASGGGAAGAGSITFVNIEDAWGGAYNDIITGNGGANFLYGAGGNDTMDGGGGADRLEGGSGDDTYIVDDAGDLVSENASEGVDTVYTSVSWTLGENVENLTLTGSSAINGTGNSLWNWMLGNSGPNAFAGDAGGDYIEAMGGNDTLDCGAGVDTLIGGAGDDTYVVDVSGDVVTENAGEGTDGIESSVTWTLGANVENLTLTGTGTINGTGNALNNWLFGNSANNTLTGADGNDRLDGLSGNDSLVGGLGNDTLYGGAGTDTMIGGLGDDLYGVSVTGDVVTENAGEGNDTISTDVTLTLGANIENLVLAGTSAINGTGNTLANSIVGNSAANTLTGGDGNDTLDGGGGTDSLVGGLGNDTFIVDVSTDVVNEAASAGTDTVQSSVTWTLGTNLENLTLIGGSAINGTGNTLNNVITGNSAANALSGGTGSDTLIGGLGDDIYTVDVATDVVTEAAGEGIDRVNASVAWTLGANVEDLTLTGTSAINGTGNALDNWIIGNGGANTLTGNDGNDRLEGMDGNDTLVGGNGNDTLYGGNGTDSMRGGLGDDTYGVSATTDVITENAGEGIDTVKTAVTLTLGANLENLILDGASAINGTGNTLNNALTGNSAANTLTGGAGNDTLDGGAGNDVLDGGAGDDAYYVLGSDTLSDSGGFDEVFADRDWTLGVDFENLTLIGTGNWNAVGNNMGNRITGNVGNNSISGRGGNDTLFGGDGDDVFNVSLGGTSTYGTDTIDGGSGVDVIDWGSNAVSAVSVDLAAGTASGGGSAGAGSMTFANIENAWGGAYNDTMTGNTGANFLFGAAGNDTLDGGAGADRLEGGTGDDTYRLGRSHGAETVIENDATAGNTDVAKFLVDIARDQIWFQQSGNNLVVSVIGTGDQLTVQDWYVGSQHRVERFETSGGDALLAGQVQNLVNAMASFSPPAPGQYTLPSEYAAQLNPVIAANWQ